MPRRRRSHLLGALAGALLLAGCGSGAGAATSSAPSASNTAAAVEAAQYAANTPPAAARMVCSDEIRGVVADALGLDSVAAPTSGWADHVYTCTYGPPGGSLVLSVEVAKGDAAARSRLQDLHARVGATTSEPGLGQQGWSAPAGTVLAVKDNMILTVDATGMPDDVGATHESRLDLARVLAAAVFSCWSGAT